MVMKGVSADAVSFFSSNTNQSTSKSASSDSKFVKVMDQNVQASKKTDTDQDTTAKQDKEKAVTGTGDVTKTESKTEAKTETTDKAQDTKDVSEKDETATVTTPLTEKEEDTLQKMEQILSALGIQISNAVKQVLNISDEELNGAMEELGMKMIDLLQPDNLKQLILKVNGNQDVTSLLTNEVMATEYAQLSDQLENIDLSSELDITKEELKTMLEKMPQAMSGVKSADVEQFSEKTTLADRKNQTDVSNEPVVEITIETQDKNAEQTLRQSGSELQSDSKEQTSESDKTGKSVVDTFIQNLAGVTVQNTEEVSEQAAKITQMKEIVTQVVDKIKVLIQPEASSMEIQLNPENLGKVNLSVVAKNGQLTASFVTENQLAKEALENQMHILKENLNNQGIKVDAIEVTVSSFAFQQNSSQADAQGRQQKGNAKRQINLDSFDYNEDVTEEDLLAAKVLTQSGGSVDYTA